MSILKSVILEMAIRRNEWVARVRNNLLGAFTEYLCGVIAVSIGEPNHWEGEVKGLFTTVTRIMDAHVKFDKEEALKEAFIEVLSYWTPVTRARNKLVRYYPKAKKQIIHTVPNLESEFENMLTTYAPEYVSTLHIVLGK